MTDLWDCVVIGGGPAGLTGAIYLARFRRTVLVVDAGASRAQWIPHSHNLPGFPEGVEGSALLERMRTQARLYGAVIRGAYVENLERGDDGRFTLTVDGAPIVSRAIILATGVVENKPPLPHLADAVKRGLVRTCPICDGYESIDKRIAVVGAGEHAAAEALFLRTYTDALSLLLVGDGPDLSPGAQRALDEARIEVGRLGAGSLQLQDNGVTALCADDGQARRFEAVYTAFGTTPQTHLAKALGARLDSDGRLYVNEHQETSIDGLFAAGDLVRGLNQISVANGEAAIAATAVHNRLPRTFA